MAPAGATKFGAMLSWAELGEFVPDVGQVCPGGGAMIPLELLLSNVE